MHYSSLSPQRHTNSIYQSSSSLPPFSPQLPPQWSVHSNRLSFLQQSISKVHLKLRHLQKTISFGQERNYQMRREFKTKLKEIVQVLVDKDQKQKQPYEAQQVNNQISQCMQQLNAKLEMLDQRQTYLEDKNTILHDDIAKDIQQYINEQHSLSQHNINERLDQRLSEVTSVIKQLQKTTQQLKSNSNKAIIRPSALQLNPARQQGLFSSRSKKTLLFQSPSQANESTIKTSQSRINQIADRISMIGQKNKEGLPVNHIYNVSTHSLHSNVLNNSIHNSTHNNGVHNSTHNNGTHNSTHNNGVHNSTKNTPIHNNSAQNSSTHQSQNSSRVVYLRQKLKEFEQINKKYDKKQHQYDTKKKQATSPSSQQHNQKFQKLSHLNNSSQFFKSANRQSLYTGQKDEQVLSKKSNTKLQAHLNTNREPFLKQQRANLSASKRSVQLQFSLKSGQKSAQKIDKLRSIKDYLEQTQSQCDQSLLQPNYQHNLKF